MYETHPHALIASTAMGDGMAEASGRASCSPPASLLALAAAG
jgi:hypothetical protein